MKPEAGGAAGAASTSPHLAEYITSPDPPPRTSSPPAAAPPGPYKRPPGRAAKGTRWDSTEGEWVPEEAQFTGAWARRATPDAADGAGGSVAKFKVDGERYTVRASRGRRADGEGDVGDGVLCGPARAAPARPPCARAPALTAGPRPRR